MNIPYLVSLEETQPGVFSSATDSAYQLSEVDITWNTVALESVPYVDIVVYGYQEIQNNITFIPVLTLAESVNYTHGHVFLSDIPSAVLSFDVGVIAVIDSRDIYQG